MEGAQCQSPWFASASLGCQWDGQSGGMNIVYPPCCWGTLGPVGFSAEPSAPQTGAGCKSTGPGRT